MNDDIIDEITLDEINEFIGELNITASLSGVVARNLENFDLNVEDIYPQIKLKIPDVNNPTERISFEQFSELLSLITDKSQDPCIGVKIFSHLKVADLSALGFAFFCSTTLIVGIERFRRFLPFIISSGQIDIVEDDDDYLFFISAPESLDTDSISYYRVLECFISGAIAVIQEISNSEIGFSEIYLQQASNQGAIEYLSDKANCICNVNAPFDCIKMSKKLATDRLPSANPEMAMINEQLISEHLNKIFKTNIIYQVELLVATRLGEGTFSKPQIAKELAMSERKLHDKLAKEGVTFVEVVNRVRKNLAMQYIKNGQYRINEIAYKLGFTSSSNFSRAFKQWTGCSPREFKDL